VGLPTVISLNDLDILWKCNDCGNTEKFYEDWVVEIAQEIKTKSQEVYLEESINIRCKICNSFNVVNV
jgi:hypothetical protein